MASVIAPDRRIGLGLRAPSPETVNRWTHAAGFAASLPAVAWLIGGLSGKADGYAVAAFAVYGVALSALYAASTLSHAFEDRPDLRMLFRTADQVCIFLLIAGTFTPFAVVVLRTPFGLAQLAAVWLVAFAGIAVRIRRRGATVRWPDIALCLLGGWIPVASAREMWALGGFDGFLLIAGGGLCYSGGVLFLMNDHRNRYLHGVWHLATIAGSACHFAFLAQYVAA